VQGFLKVDPTLPHLVLFYGSAKRVDGEGKRRISGLYGPNGPYNPKPLFRDQSFGKKQAQAHFLVSSFSW